MIVTLDLESFYSREIGFSKLTTEAYVKDPQFEVIGMGIKLGTGPTIWYPQPEVKDYLASVDWTDKFILCQNTAFDGAVLSWHYNVNPKGWLDTLGMSRALFPHDRFHGLDAQAKRHGVGVKGDEVVAAINKRYADFTPEALAKYGEYCKNDVELTKTLFDLYMGMGFPRQELELIDLTLRMFIEPVLILDRAQLEVHLAGVKERKATLLDDVRDMMLADADPDFVHAVFTEGVEGIKKLLMSNDKFADLLRRFHVEPPMKISLTTGKEAYAFAKTDEGFKALESHDDDRIQGLMAARLGNKTTIEETRTQRFIEMSYRGAFPIPLRYYGAHSGRWSGQDAVNLQNLTSNPKNPNAGKIKRAIMAPEGYVVIDCDSAQIEARTLAWLAGQDDLLAAFERKEDVYKLMATRIYNIPMAQVDKLQRQVGKVVILGAGYGVGHAKLKLFLKTQAGVEVTDVEAKRIIDTYRATYFRIPQLWRKAEASLRSLALGVGMPVDVPGLIRAVPGKGLSLPNGLFIQYPDLKRIIHRTPQEEKQQWVYQSKGLPVHVYGGKAVENFTQAVARIVVGEQMLRIAKRYKVVLTVHDSVAIIAKKAEANEARAFVEACMSWRPKWAQGLPLACESGMGASYGDC